MENDLVYHYCGIESFVNIIRTSSIWLSDYKKLNDYAEEQWIKDKVNNRIKEQLSYIDEKAYDIWNDYYGCNTFKTSTYFIGCFSEVDDDLNQWTRYADNGRGVAIGFSKKYLCELKEKFRISFNKVEYSETEQEKFVTQIAREIIDKFDIKSVMHVAAEFDTNYTRDFLTYKNPSFSSEKEWRIIYFTSPTSHKIKSSYGDFEFSKLDFRVDKNRIISYVPMDFSKIKKDVIKEIHLGSSSMISVSDVKDLLETYGYYENVDFDDNDSIKIIKSKSTYKSY